MIDNAVKTFKPIIPFGVEIEINSLSVNRISGPTDCMHEVASLVNRISKDRVQILKWCNNHHNRYWVVKPDSSCGIEICSPVLKGWYGINKVFDLVKSLKENRASVDSRCSFHVHFDVSSFTNEQLLSIICWWIKLEGFFLGLVPLSRKTNPYCKLISQSEIIDSVSSVYDLSYLTKALGVSKYYTLNTFHLYNNRRRTIEFRIMDGFCCISPNSASCWVALLDHFINCCVLSGPPSYFKEGDAFSGFCWIDPLDAFKFLRFDSNLTCQRLKTVRKWLLNRLIVYGRSYTELGTFSEKLRHCAYKEIQFLNNLHNS